MKAEIMKARYLVLALLIAAVVAASVSLASSPEPPAADADSQRVTSVFKVDGMTCEGCEAGVRLNVKKLDGVEEVEASYKKGRATVTYDAAKVTPEKIVAAIEDLGYTAELLEPAEAEGSLANRTSAEAF